MRLRTARLLTAAYFTSMAIAVTWLGMHVASRIRPLVLGLPFAFFWDAAWIAVAVLVLWLLDRVERRYREGGTR